MKFSIIHSSGSRTLVMLMAGWGMDPHPFARLSHRSADVAVVYDYTDMTFRPEWTDGYDEVCLVAWSMGVYAAAVALSPIEHKITRRIAVNGTVTPVDDSTGIPTAIFEATLASMSERTLERFRRRMAGGSAAYATFMADAPQRDLDSLIAELRVMGSADPSRATLRFDSAIVSESDMIFPAAAQQLAWQRAGVPCTLIAGPHLAPLADIVAGCAIDKALVRRRFTAGAATYNDAASAQRTIVASLLDTLARTGADAALRDSSARVLEVGCGTGLMSRALADMRPGRLELWDIVDRDPAVDGAVFLCRDAETAVTDLAPGGLDAIVSTSSIQWFNSPSTFIARAMRALRPGGLLAFTAFGPANLSQLAPMLPAALPTPPLNRWLAMLPEGSTVVAARDYTVDCRFDSPAAVLRHLKATGVNAVSPAAPPSAVARILADYPVDPDGMCTLTYNPVEIVALAPLSPQKPDHQ